MLDKEVTLRNSAGNPVIKRVVKKISIEVPINDSSHFFIHWENEEKEEWSTEDIMCIEIHVASELITFIALS